MRSRCLEAKKENKIKRLKSPGLQEGKLPSPKVFLTLTAGKGEESAPAPGACEAGWVQGTQLESRVPQTQEDGRRVSTGSRRLRSWPGPEDPVRIAVAPNPSRGLDVESGD